MRPPSFVALSALLVLAAVSCGQPTWDEAMQAGEAALQRGQYREAEQIFTAAVHKAEEFGRHDRRVAVTLTHLAQTYSAQGKFVEAEPVYLEALKIYQEVHGENHLDVAATLNNLGVLHRKHGQFADAQRLLMRALAIKERLLGPDHLEVALAMSNLAALYQAQGDAEQAGELFQRALTVPTIPMWRRVSATMQARFAGSTGRRRRRRLKRGPARFESRRSRDGGRTKG